MLAKGKWKPGLYLILAVLVISCFGFVEGVGAIVNIDSCRSLSANKAYKLIFNVTAPVDSNCFTDSGANITLDCDGHSISENETSCSSQAFAGQSKKTTANTKIALWKMNMRQILITEKSRAYEN